MVIDIIHYLVHIIGSIILIIIALILATFLSGIIYILGQEIKDVIDDKRKQGKQHETH